MMSPLAVSQYLPRGATDSDTLSFDTVIFDEASIEGAVDRSAGGEAESPFEDAVGRALTQRGYRIQHQVGCAKYSCAR